MAIDATSPGRMLQLVVSDNWGFSSGVDLKRYGIMNDAAEPQQRPWTSVYVGGFGRPQRLMCEDTQSPGKYSSGAGIHIQQSSPAENKGSALEMALGWTVHLETSRSGPPDSVVDC